MIFGYGKGLTENMKNENVLRVGVVGYGGRGRGVVNDVLLGFVPSQIEITAVCDSYADRAETACDDVYKATGTKPAVFTDYRELCEKSDIDAIFVFSAWEAHFDIAICAMRHGIAVGFEVGGAYSIDKLWQLVHTCEETGVNCMMLENCCYGERELMALGIARRGLFGEIVQCSGGYCHDLRGEITGGIENRHYRLRNYVGRNCENYPTHELGPIAKLLNINNGNRMLTLTSVASGAHGLAEYVGHENVNERVSSFGFAQGDIVNTTIKCAGGQTILLTLDTTLPRTYDRAFTVRGTKGGYFGITDSIFFDGEHNGYEFCGEKLWGNASEYAEKYKHPIWRDYDPHGGHGGMDYLVMSAFIDSVKNNVRPPIDVYDSASWAAISVLSEQSIALGGAPVAIPDFTNGRWLCRDDIADSPESFYNLDDKEIAKKYRKN